MKIESSKQVRDGRADEQTNQQRLAFLELLSEPKGITKVDLTFTFQ